MRRWYDRLTNLITTTRPNRSYSSDSEEFPEVLEVAEDIEGAEADEYPTFTEPTAPPEPSAQRKDLVIVLFGETGTGKSTLINAFANYLTAESFDDLLTRGTPICLIPTRFSVTDEDDREHICEAGSDVNESSQVGASCTQSCREYSFPVDAYTVRLVDTPGIGDTRGILQDKENMENILGFLSQYPHINGLCILLKPNSTRLTPTFEFCLKQLLIHLSKDASSNLAFVFTNARGTFYKPGDAGPILRSCLEQIEMKSPSIKFKFDKDNKFCLDNEAFRFLIAAKSSSLHFSGNDVADFRGSWEKSTQEAIRLLHYIISLPPHNIQNTISINEARRIIFLVSKPLADISNSIATNVTALEIHKQKILECNNDTKKLEKLKFVPIVDLEMEYFNEPRTVCTGPECRKLIMVGDINKWHYPTICHDPCYLSNVPKEIVGDPALQGCAAMSGKPECQLCGCNFSLHMHIYYTTREAQRKVINENIKSSIERSVSEAEQTQAMLDAVQEEIDNLERAQSAIVRISAKFAIFLKQHAIAPYNDAYEKYIQLIIENQETLTASGVDNKEFIKRLKSQLQRYKEEMKIMNNLTAQTSNSVSDVNFELTPAAIYAEIEKLKAISVCGVNFNDIFKKFKRLVDIQFDPHETKIRAKIDENVARKRFAQKKTQSKTTKDQRNKSSSFNYYYGW